MNETRIRKGTIMKRTTTLALLALTCLTAIPSIAHARYRDGMNLYEYVRSNPVDGRDPSGQIKVLAKNDDVVAAYDKVKSTTSGKKLIDCIEKLETTGKKEKVSVVIVMSRSPESGSVASGISKRTIPFVVARKAEKKIYRYTIADGKQKKKISFTITPFEEDHSYKGQNVIRMSMNPLYVLVRNAKNIGCGPEQIEIGSSLDGRMFHELTHVKQRLLYYRGKGAAPKMLVTGDAVVKEDAQLEGLKTMTKQQKVDWYKRWISKVEYAATVSTNRYYRKELGRDARWSYALTEDQQRELLKLQELTARGEMEYKYPLREIPVFYDVETYKARLVKEMFRKGQHKSNSVALALLRRNFRLEEWLKGVQIQKSPVTPQPMSRPGTGVPANTPKP